jgi:hypothetical protein
VKPEGGEGEMGGAAPPPPHRNAPTT